VQVIQLIFYWKPLPLVYTGENNGGNILHTNVKFVKVEGILLKLNDKIINNTAYETKIIWKILHIKIF
jgi:hypothetical protein